MKREKDFKRNFKNSGKIKRIFFAHKMFLNQENRNRKQKRVFPTFHEKKTFLFLDTSKRRKKRNRVEKKNQKKAGYKNEKPFFQDTEKDQTWKNMKKKPREKETEKTKFFLM